MQNKKKEKGSNEQKLFSQIRGFPFVSLSLSPCV